jgi:hypothetical protein
MTSHAHSISGAQLGGLRVSGVLSGSNLSLIFRIGERQGARDMTHEIHPNPSANESWSYGTGSLVYKTNDPIMVLAANMSSSMLWVAIRRKGNWLMSQTPISMLLVHSCSLEMSSVSISSHHSASDLRIPGGETLVAIDVFRSNFAIGRADR